MAKQTLLERQISQSLSLNKNAVEDKMYLDFCKSVVCCRKCLHSEFGLYHLTIYQPRIEVTSTNHRSTPGTETLCGVCGNIAHHLTFLWLCSNFLSCCYVVVAATLLVSASVTVQFWFHVYPGALELTSELVDSFNIISDFWCSSIHRRVISGDVTYNMTQLDGDLTVDSWVTLPAIRVHLLIIWSEQSVSQDSWDLRSKTKSRKIYWSSQLETWMDAVAVFLESFQLNWPGRSTSIQPMYLNSENTSLTNPNKSPLSNLPVPTPGCSCHLSYLALFSSQGT